MAPSKHVDEGGQLQLMEADRIEEEDRFESIDKLISQGINKGDVKKLQDAGIYTCNGLMMHTKKSLTGIKGLSEEKVERICEAAEKLLRQGFITGSDLLIKDAAPFASPSTGDLRGVAKMPKQSSEGHTTASAVAESLPQALPTIVMASLEPFVQLVRLVGRGFYNDVAIKNGEVKTGCVTCFDNCGLAVIVLDNLTRYSWVKEKELAKFLNIKEKDMLLLLGFLEKEKLLTREKIKRAKLKIKASTSDAQRCQNIGENEYETWSIPAGSYCCLNYAQVFNVTRNRLHSMKEALKDELACGNTVEQYIEEYICCICKRSYSALEAMHLMSSNGDTFNCEHCKAELIARSDLKGTKRERRTKFVDTSKSMKEQLRPLESQLNILKNLPVPHFGSLKQWTRNNVVEYVVASSSSDTMSPFLGQTKVEIALPDSSAKEADAESDSNIAGMKTLPTWLLRKAMAITKAEVGNHGSHEEERQIGIKSKRNDGDCGVVEFSASIRRRT